MGHGKRLRARLQWLDGHETDDEVRGVLGHEMGHMALGHSKKAMQVAYTAVAAHWRPVAPVRRPRFHSLNWAT